MFGPKTTKTNSCGFCGTGYVNICQYHAWHATTNLTINLWIRSIRSCERTTTSIYINPNQSFPSNDFGKPISHWFPIGKSLGFPVGWFPVSPWQWPIQRLGPSAVWSQWTWQIPRSPDSFAALSSTRDLLRCWPGRWSCHLADVNMVKYCEDRRGFGVMLTASYCLMCFKMFHNMFYAFAL